MTKWQRPAGFSDRAPPSSAGWKSETHAPSESLGTALPCVFLAPVAPGLAVLGLQLPCFAPCLARHLALSPGACLLAWGPLPPLWKPVIMDEAPSSPAPGCPHLQRCAFPVRPHSVRPGDPEMRKTWPLEEVQVGDGGGDCGAAGGAPRVSSTPDSYVDSMALEPGCVRNPKRFCHRQPRLQPTAEASGS